jgi:hypothetical protein
MNQQQLQREHQTMVHTTLWHWKKTLMMNSKTVKKMKIYPYLQNQEMDGTKIIITAHASDKDLQ